MRKISRLLTMVILCLATILLPTACGPKIEKAVVQPGTLELTVAKGTEYDTSNIVVEFTYSDDEKVTVTASELDFVLPDTTQVSDNAKLTIKYDNYSFDVTIRVVATEADVNSVSSFTSWSNNIYKDNITNNTVGFYNHTYNATTDLEEGDDEKYLGIEPRYVGTDNPFVLDLTMAGYDGAGEFIPEVTNVRTNITVALIEGTTETVLDETTTPKLSEMVTFETINAKFQFKTAAQGRTFKVTVEPANKEVGTQTIMKVETILKVTEGFNVHNAKELSVYDNSGRDYNWDNVADWNAIKEPILTAAGLPLNYVPTKILIQNDISITAEDVPSTMFWSNTDEKYEFWDYDKNDYDAHNARFSTLASKVGGVDENGKEIELAGSMIDRDHTGVYHFNFNNTNSQLELVGNYFNISVAQFPRAVVETTGREAVEGTDNRWVNTSEDAYSYMTSHSTLFCHTFRAYDAQGRLTNTDANMTKETSISWKNLDFTGNGSATDEAQYSGSIILFKSYRVNSDIYNCVSNYFAINYLMAEGDSELSTAMTGHAFNGEYRIDYCKGYSSYQALLFANGAKHMLVSNSEFVKSSGPAIITVFHDYEDYVDYQTSKNWDEHDFNPSCLDIVNTKVESYVSGQEPWFMINAPGMDLENLLGLLEGYLDGSFETELKEMVKQYYSKDLETNKTIYNPEKSTATKKVLNAKVATILSGRDGNGAYYTVPALGYTREFASMAEYEEFYATATEDTEYGLQLNGHINQNLAETISDMLTGDYEDDAPLYMSDNMGGFIGTNNYGVGSDYAPYVPAIQDFVNGPFVNGAMQPITNKLGMALTMIIMATSSNEDYVTAAQALGITLEKAIEAYQNAFAEEADRFYLYTPANISVLIDLYDRP